MSDNLQIAPRNWLTDSDVASAELEVDEAAEVTHLASRRITNVCIRWVVMVRRSNLGGA